MLVEISMREFCHHSFMKCWNQLWLSTMPLNCWPSERWCHSWFERTLRQELKTSISTLMMCLSLIWAFHMSSLELLKINRLLSRKLNVLNIKWRKLFRIRRVESSLLKLRQSLPNWLVSHYRGIKPFWSWEDLRQHRRLQRHSQQLDPGIECSLTLTPYCSTSPVLLMRIWRKLLKIQEKKRRFNDLNNENALYDLTYIQL